MLFILVNNVIRRNPHFGRIATDFDLSQIIVTVYEAEESRLQGSGPPPPPDSGDLVAGTWDFTRTRRWDLALLEY